MTQRRAIAAVLGLLCAFCFLFGCQIDLNAESGGGQALASGELAVHFIDVGQADAILIQTEGETMLIDAGNQDDGDLIRSYLNANGVETLNYVIATHPHEDHIGGMAQVLNAFPADTVILPETEHPTRIFERMLDAIEAQDCAVEAPVVGKQYSIGQGRFTILAPGEDYGEDLNNWSVGIRLCFGQTSFVLCGDAETESERDMVRSGQTLEADVLKLGHHGSSTSTCDEFLHAVQPDYAVISCGAGNDYGHPHREIIQKLEAEEITYFRTDEAGTVVAKSDGKNMTWNVTPSYVGAANPAAGETSGTGENAPSLSAYVLNTNTKKFHKPDCGSVSQMKTEYRKEVQSTRETLVAEGYSPCGSCNP